MIAVIHHRGKLWLRLKLFFAPGKAGQPITTAKSSAPKAKRRSHRTTAFFEMP